MIEKEGIGSVEKVALTVLVDNRADLVLESSERIQYFTKKPLTAEHGFSVLLQVDDSHQFILWDAGVSESALTENMHRLGLDVHAISLIALSHGHRDHYAAIASILREMALIPQAIEWGKKVNKEEVENWILGHQIPIVAHPAAFRERWWLKDDGVFVGPMQSPPELEWKAAGAELIHSTEPYQLTRGCWTTGFVPRTSFEKSGRPKRLFYRDGSGFIPDDLDEDQAIVINVRDRGLVVLSGCAHAGIVNTVKYAREFTGIDQVYAVAGGFHMAHASDDEINQTIDYFQEIKPTYVIPAHCTGFRAACRIAQAMPDTFFESVVGATFLL